MEYGASPRVKVLPEAPAPAHQVLPEPGLRLVNTQRRRLAHRRSVVLRLEALLVQSVAGLVKYCEEPAGKVATREPRRDAAVSRSAAGAEWVERGVQSAALEIEAHRRRDGLTEQALAIHREFASLAQAAGSRLAAGRNGLDQGQQFSLEFFEQAGSLSRGHSRLVVIEQGVVGGFGISHGFGFFTRELHDSLEPGPECVVVARLARAGPGLLRQRRHPGQLCDQLARQLALPIVAPPDLPGVHRRGRLDFAHQTGTLDHVEQLAQARIGAAIVQQAGQQRELLAAMGDPTTRQAGLLVPFEQIDAGREESFLPGETDQLFVSRLWLHLRIGQIGEKILIPTEAEKPVSQEEQPQVDLSPAEAAGLAGMRLAAHVRQALYRIPTIRLADAHRHMPRKAAERRVA